MEKKIPLYVRYEVNFAILAIWHVVRFYKSWSQEKGLEDEVLEEGCQATNKQLIIKEIKHLISKEQLKKLAFMMADRERGIVHPDGSYSKL